MYRLRLKQCQVNVDVDSIIANPKVYLFDYHLFSFIHKHRSVFLEYTIRLQLCILSYDTVLFDVCKLL